MAHTVILHGLMFTHNNDMNELTQFDMYASGKVEMKMQRMSQCYYISDS